MSEPLHSGRGENHQPRQALAPGNQPASDIDRADPGTSANNWFHRTAARPAPRATPRTRTWAPPSPTLASEQAAARRRGLHAVPDTSGPKHDKQLSVRLGTHPLSLTWEQIDYLTARDKAFDAMFDDQYWHDTVLFDRAIDAEPEIDEPEMG
jgi:hypothetical protein